MRLNRASAVALGLASLTALGQADAGVSEDLGAAAAEAARAPEITHSGPTMDIEALDLEELLDTRVESVSRREERAALAPASVFVVSREDIRRQGMRTLADVLRSVPGLFIVEDGIYPVAGVRGVATPGDLTTRFLVMVDGHPLNNSVGIGQSYLSRDFPVSVRAIEQVEVIKGPVGSVYGPIAYLGVVNVITRKGQDQDHAVELAASGELGPLPNGGELEAVYNGRAGEVSWLLNFGLYRSNGLTWAFPELVGQDRDVPEGGLVEGADWRWSNQAYGTVRFRELTLTLGWSQRDKGLPTAPYSVVVGDPRNHFYNRTGFAQLVWDRKLSDLVDLYARVGYDDFRYDDDLVYLPPPDDSGLFYDLGVDRWGSAELRATVRPFESHRDVIGVEVQYHDTLQRAQYRDVPNLDEDPVDGFGVGDIPYQYAMLNAYLLVEQRLLADKLLLQAGLTFYAHQLFGYRLTPKLAGVYQLTDDDTVKAYYSEGFRPPTIFEAAFEDGLDFIPNDQLSPESARTVELSYERRLPQLATVGLTLYHSRFDNLIRSATVPAPGLDHEPDPENPSDFRQQFLNGGNAATTGAELFFNLRYRKWVQAYGGLAVQLGDFGGNDSEAAGFAPVTANLAVATQALWEPLSLALNLSFVSERTKDPDTLLIEGDRTTVPAYALLNASARLELPWLKGAAAQLAVYNLLDTRYADPLVGDHAPLSELRNPGRTFRAELEYRF